MTRPAPEEERPAAPVTLVAVWTCGRCGTALRPRPGQLVAAMKAHAETCVTTSEQQARAFSRAVFVDGEISLGDFMTRLAEYGDARVREALARAEALAASAQTVVTTTGDAREEAIGAVRVDLERWRGTREPAPTS